MLQDENKSLRDFLINEFCWPSTSSLGFYVDILEQAKLAKMLGRSLETDIPKIIKVELDGLLFTCSITY
jgi:hypothetical protein